VTINPQLFGWFCSQIDRQTDTQTETKTQSSWGTERRSNQQTFQITKSVWRACSTEQLWFRTR